MRLEGTYVEHHPNFGEGRLYAEHGYVHYGVDKRRNRVFIHNAQVDAEHRGQGIGLALLTAVADRYPDFEMDCGYTTDEGERLWQSWLRKRAAVAAVEDDETATPMHTFFRRMADEAKTNPTAHAWLLSELSQPASSSVSGVGVTTHDHKMEVMDHLRGHQGAFALARLGAIHDIEQPHHDYNQYWLDDETKKRNQEERDRKDDEFHHAVTRELGLDPETTPRYQTRDIWQKHMKQAMSRGDISYDDAVKKGYHSTSPRETGDTDYDGNRRGGWQPLPRAMLHVTTDLDSVMKNGLKSREELGQKYGKGLGGGDDTAISATTDHSLAHDIYHSLHEYHAVLNGKKSIGDCLDEAKNPKRVGATPHFKEVASVFDGTNYDRGDEPGPRLKNMRDGVVDTLHDWHSIPEDKRPGTGNTSIATVQEAKAKDPAWEPHPDAQMHTTPEGETYHYRWTRPATEEENVHRRSEFYKTFSRVRGSHGGPRDPLFISNDPAGFAKSDPKNFGIVSLKPRPGAQGYPLSRVDHHPGADSGEWRVHSGDAFHPVEHFEAPWPDESRVPPNHFEASRKVAIGFPANGAFITGNDTIHPHCEHHEADARDEAFAESPDVQRTTVLGMTCPHCEKHFPQPPHEPSAMQRHLVSDHHYDPQLLPGGKHYESHVLDDRRYPESWLDKPDLVARQIHAEEHDETNDGVPLNGKSHTHENPFKEAAVEELPGQEPLFEPSHKGHLPNPIEGGHDWHHGTPSPVADIRQKPEYDDEGDQDDHDYEADNQRHWNSYLGDHWTSVRGVADSFAEGGYHHKNTTTHGVGSVFTGNLRMKNPKVYHHETRMDSEAVQHAWDSHDYHDPQDFHAEHCHTDGCYGLDEHEDGDEVSTRVRNQYATRHHAAHWLGTHPNKEDIAWNFKNHLSRQGHDGVVYGNEVEGPGTHPCAITFHPHQAEGVRRSAPRSGQGAKWEFQHFMSPPHRPDEWHDKIEEGLGKESSKKVVGSHEPLPHGRMFGPTKPNLDPRLFDGDSLKDTVRSWILDTLDKFWRPRYGEWRRWTHVYFAGSEASHWWGNNDFDVLVGIEPKRFVQANPQFSGLDETEICAVLNGEFREILDPEVTGHDGFEVTFYCNPNSWDIRPLKPYAAYDVTHDEWAVPSPVLPDNKPEDFDPKVWDLVDKYAARVRHILALPPGEFRRAQADALYTYLHNDRQRAFSPRGKGWRDAGNVVYKALDMHPDHLLKALIEARHS